MTALYQGLRRLLKHLDPLPRDPALLHSGHRIRTQRSLEPLEGRKRKKLPRPMVQHI